MRQRFLFAVASRTGRHVAYVSRGRVFVHDARRRRNRRIGRGADPSISAGGRKVAFTRDPTEGYARVMLRDLRRGRTRVAVRRAFTGRLSADGRWLGFVEAARDPSQVFVTDLPG